MKSRALALVMAGSMMINPATQAFAEEATDSFAVQMADNYKEAELKYRPYARWWLAEGSHTDTTLIEAVHDLYDTGYGGLEIVTLDESAYLDDATYGWGSPEWIHDTQLIVSECQKLGMSVSMTSGTHFSSANLTVISPDDAEASQELGYTTVELKGTEGENTSYTGKIDVCVLPEDVTKQKLVTAVAAKVTDWGSEDSIPVLDQDSLTVIKDQVTAEEDGSYSVDFTADDDGDYILFAFYQYGTGEYYLPASTGRSYTINYLSPVGADALINYWNEEVLTENLQETIDGLEECTIYMDSLELMTQGENSTKQLWCDEMLDTFEQSRGYSMEKYLPLMIRTLELGVVGFGQEITYAYAGTDETFTNNLMNDFFQTQTEMYTENCLAKISDWLHSRNMQLRAEPSYGKTFEVSESVKAIDYVETESFEFNNELDLYRTLSGAAHLYNMRYSSETGAALGNNYVDNNGYYRQIFYMQYAAGIQKMVTHGYNAGYGPEEHVEWPGYEGMNDIFSERFDRRQPGYVDYVEINGHLSRLQKVLEQGVPQMDLAILRTDYYVNNGMWTASNELLNNKVHNNEGYYWQDMELQNAGYTYDYFSPYLLTEDAVTMTDGMINSDGAAYKAVIVMQDEMPCDAAKELLEGAKNGLPIVFVNNAVEIINKSNNPKVNTVAASTTGSNDGRDEELAGVIAEIKALENVRTVESEEDAYDALQELGISPRAEYAEPNAEVLSVMRKDDRATYLYFYNYMYGNTEAYSGDVWVEGCFEPYVLDTWTGTVNAVEAYEIADGRTKIHLDLMPGDVTVFIMEPSEVEAFEATAENKQTEEIVLTGWDLKVDSFTPGEIVTRTETTEETGVETTEVTYTTNHETLEAGVLEELVSWKDIPAIGDTVSGIGTYSTVFSLPEERDGTEKVFFTAESFQLGTAALWVNGEKVPINMDGKKADITAYVKPGENTIEVRVTSSLRNIMRKVGYDRGWVNEMFGLTEVPEAADYGMTGEAKITVEFLQ